MPWPVAPDMIDAVSSQSALASLMASFQLLPVADCVSFQLPENMPLVPREANVTPVSVTVNVPSMPAPVNADAARVTPCSVTVTVAFRFSRAIEASVAS